jgi:hypothetical protein
MPRVGHRTGADVIDAVAKCNETLTSLDISGYETDMFGGNVTPPVIPTITELIGDKLRKLTISRTPRFYDIENLTRGCPHLTWLDVSECVHLMHVGPIVVNCPMLEHLDIRGCWRVEDFHALSLTKLPHLKYLDISGVGNNSDDDKKCMLFDHHHHPALQTFKANNCPLFKASEIRELADTCRSLTSVDLGNNHDHSHLQMTAAISYLAQNCIELKEVKLDNSDYYNDAIVTITQQHCCHLLRLSLMDSIISNRSVAALSSLTQLESLQLGFNGLSTWAPDGDMIVTYECFTQLMMALSKTLKELEYTAKHYWSTENNGGLARDWLDDDDDDENIPLTPEQEHEHFVALSRTITGCRQLERLTTDDPHGIDFANGDETMPLLRYLNIRNRKHIPVTDADIGHIARRCPNLENLMFDNEGILNKSVTNATLEHLADYCTELKFLDMSRCPNITEEGVTAACQRGLGKLKTHFYHAGNAGNWTSQMTNRSMAHIFYSGR